MNLNQLEEILLEHPDLSGLSAEEQFDLLAERSKHIVGESRLKDMLKACKKEGRGLRVKYGIDATARSIHLGHAVPLFVLRRLQNMGHDVTLLIGDFTARVGDPTGRVSTRPVLSDEDIANNAKAFTAQAGKVIDIDRTTVVFNSDWLSGFKLADLFRILSGLTVAQAMQRDDFRTRASITRSELLYSTLMAIDSVHLNAELELGGDDQLLNFYDAERVMENEGLTPESALTTGLLLGTTGDGKKMSKSEGNFIAITEEPAEKFGKLMSIPDTQLEMYFKLLTDIRDASWDELAAAMDSGSVNPMDVKRLLARVVVADLDGRDAAKQAETAFNTRIVQKDIPDDLEVIEINKADAPDWILLLRKLNLPQASSNSKTRRLLEQSGVHLLEGTSDTTIGPEDLVPATGLECSIRIGKRTYCKFRIV